MKLRGLNMMLPTRMSQISKLVQTSLSKEKVDLQLPIVPNIFTFVNNTQKCGSSSCSETPATDSQELVKLRMLIGRLNTDSIGAI